VYQHCTTSWKIIRQKRTATWGYNNSVTSVPNWGTYSGYLFEISSTDRFKK
jgi:hypothetical protein